MTHKMCCIHACMPPFLGNMHTHTHHHTPLCNPEQARPVSTPHQQRHNLLRHKRYNPPKAVHPAAQVHRQYISQLHQSVN